jgi:uncharacterized protein (DUF1501 family)
VIAVSLTQELPMALQARKVSVPCFASLGDLQMMTADPELERTVRAIAQMETKPTNAARVIRDSTRTALEAVERLREAVGNYRSTVEYPNDPFAQGLKQAAQLIATSPYTRILYVSVNGFDTHAAQARTHEQLLQRFGNAVRAFYQDLEQQGKADKVLLMVFSEFRSAGTRERQRGHRPWGCCADVSHQQAGQRRAVWRAAEPARFGQQRRHPHADRLPQRLCDRAGVARKRPRGGAGQIVPTTAAYAVIY